MFLRDAAGRTRAYVERGAQLLQEMGWLEVETVGQRRAAKTTFRLLPGERLDYLDADWAMRHSLADDELDVCVLLHD